MNFSKVFFLGLTTLTSLSFFQIFTRSRIISVGYDIGQLKNKESILIEEQAILRTELAKISTKTSLEKIINTSEPHNEVATR